MTPEEIQREALRALSEDRRGAHRGVRADYLRDVIGVWQPEALIAHLRVLGHRIEVTQRGGAACVSAARAERRRSPSLPAKLATAVVSA